MFCTEKLKLYTGAKIVTLYDPMPIVEAVCVIGERIHAIGSLEDMERYAALCGEYEKIDLGGGVLYPGFVQPGLLRLPTGHSSARSRRVA